MPRTYTTPRGITLQYVRALGNGQFGIAKEVRAKDGTSFCMKEIPIKVSDSAAKQQALTEVTLMKETCSHDNIITFYDSWFECNRLCILMEFAPNGSLDKLLHKCAKTRTLLTATKVAHFVEELAGALDYCHNSLKIIHRDIKPANILIDQLGSLKLTDFGLSKSLVPTNDLAMTYCGSPLYMAPEQLLEEDSYSFPADMWAMGCVVYEIMTLSSPWSAAMGVPKLINMIMCTTPNYDAISQRYSSRMADMTRWMLRRNTTKRATARDIVSLLEMRAPPVPLADTIYQPTQAMRAPSPPSPEPTVSESPVTSSIERTQTIVEDAMRLVKAATSIQRSYRLSQQMRRHIAPLPPSNGVPDVTIHRLNLFERPRPERRLVGPKYRAPPPPPPMVPRVRAPPPPPPMVPRARAPPPSTTDDRRAVVIQRAMRASLNRRHNAHRVAPPSTARKGGSPNSSMTDPSKCSSRLQALAQPRVLPSAPRHPAVHRPPATRARLLRVVHSPRQAWV